MNIIVDDVLYVYGWKDEIIISKLKITKNIYNVGTYDIKNCVFNPVCGCDYFKFIDKIKEYLLDNGML